MAVHPSGEAVLQIRIAGPEADPEQVGLDFVRQMRAKARVEPASSRKVPIGPYSAFIVTYEDRSGHPPAYLHFAWVALAGHTFQLIGLAQEKHRQTLRDAALSLRPMTPVEQAAVTGKRLRIVRATAGERLEDLSARTGNTWTPTYTALANSLEKEVVLREGQLLKIAREEHWGP
jgi:predicted Zn-dependent protease